MVIVMSFVAACNIRSRRAGTWTVLFLLKYLCLLALLPLGWHKLTQAQEYTFHPSYYTRPALTSRGSLLSCMWFVCPRRVSHLPENLFPRLRNDTATEFWRGLLMDRMPYCNGYNYYVFGVTGLKFRSGNELSWMRLLILFSAPGDAGWNSTIKRTTTAGSAMRTFEYLVYECK